MSSWNDYFISILLSSFLICQNISQDRLYFSDKYPKQEIIDLYQLNILCFRYLPALGQYQLYKKTNILNQKNKAFIFFGIEVISLGMHLNFKNKHNDQKKMYKAFADQNWDFANWINTYDDFDGTDYAYIWEDDQGNYTQIGESSHYVEFYYNGELKRTTDSDFNDIYTILINDIQNGNDIYDQHNIRINNDQHFYENIGKYNYFFSGWDECDVNIIIE